MLFKTLFDEKSPELEPIFQENGVYKYDSDIVNDNIDHDTPVIIDEEVFGDMADILGEDMFNEHLQNFINDTNALMKNITDGLTSNDAHKVSEAAHALKSSSAQIGLAGLSCIAARIEILSKHGKLDFLKDNWDAINAIYTNTQEFLNED